MPSQAVKQRNTISLKGSAQIVSEYFNYAVNSILYTRGIYPNDSFKQEDRYGMPIMVTTDESLTRYLTQVTKQMQAWLEQGRLQRLVLVVNSAVGQKEVLERWTFQVETDQAVLDGGPLPEKSQQAIQKEIAGVMRQIVASVSFMPLLDDPCTFDLLVYTDKDSMVPAEWEESDPRYIAEEAQEVKLRYFTTKVHRVEAAVAYKRRSSSS